MIHLKFMAMRPSVDAAGVSSDKPSRSVTSSDGDAAGAKPVSTSITAVIMPFQHLHLLLNLLLQSLRKGKSFFEHMHIENILHFYA